MAQSNGQLLPRVLIEGEISLGVKCVLVGGVLLSACVPAHAGVLVFRVHFSLTSSKHCRVD